MYQIYQDFLLFKLDQEKKMIKNFTHIITSYFQTYIK